MEGGGGILRVENPHSYQYQETLFKFKKKTIVKARGAYVFNLRSFHWPRVLIAKEAGLGLYLRVEYLPGQCEVLGSDTTPP